MRRNPEIRRSLFNVVRVAHPADRLFRYVFKQRGRPIHFHLRLAVLADRGSFYAAVQQIGHQLGTVTNSQNRDPQLEDFLRTSGRVLSVYAVGPSCKNDALRIHFLNLFKAHSTGVDFAVHIAFSDSSGNQLIVLSAEVEDDYKFSIHRVPPGVKSKTPALPDVIPVADAL